MTPADVTYLRGQLGLTIPQLADRLGVSRSAVWRWEAGSRPVVAIAELALSYLMLLDDEGRRSETRSELKATQAAMAILKYELNEERATAILDADGTKSLVDR
jgi:transcriptional regulator with XRE-family HTH domain